MFPERGGGGRGQGGGMMLYKGYEFFAAAFCYGECQPIVPCCHQVHSLIPATSCLSTWTIGHRVTRQELQAGRPWKSSQAPDHNQV